MMLHPYTFRIAYACKTATALIYAFNGWVPRYRENDICLQDVKESISNVLRIFT